MKALYWCNLNLRDKYFGYKPTDDLVYVGVVDATDAEDAYRQFNRIDKEVPVLDEAEAPSMSIGDVVQLIENPGHMDAGQWFAVANIGFTPIEIPALDNLHGYLVSGRTAGDYIQSAVNRINSEYQKETK